MLPRYRWLFAVLMLAGCGVELSYPDGARVLCASDAQCNGDNAKCSLAAGVCVAADDPDVSPEITSVTATDSFHVVIVFSMPIPREQLAKLTNYGINHRVDISGIAIGDENTRVTLTTSLQRGRTYVLSTQALTDELGRQLVALEATFEGVGDPVDGAGPVTLSPSDRSRATQRETVFTWTANVDAETYTLEIASDPAFANVVESLDDIVDTSASVTFAADGTYYWRVKADVSAYSEVAVFGVVQDGMHVFCAATAASCSEDLSVFHGGDPTHPLTDPVYAIALARTVGVQKLRLARRDATDTPYEAALILSGSTFALEGGYDATFAPRAPTARTAVSVPQTALRVSGSGITVSGLALLGGTRTAPTVVLAGGPGNTLSDLDIMATDFEAMPLRVASTTEARLVNVQVDGVTSGNDGHDSQLDSAQVVMDHTRFVTRGLTVTGVSDAELIDGSVTTTAVTLPDADASHRNHAIIVGGLARLALVRSTVRVDAEHNGYDITVIFVEGGTLRVESSRIYGVPITGDCGGFGCQSKALHSQFAAVALADSLVVGVAPYGVPVRVDQDYPTTKQFVAINSTFVNNVPSPAIFVATGLGTVPSTNVVLMNDLFVVADGAVDACVFVIDGPPVVVANNAFLGCAKPVSGFDTVSDLNLGPTNYVDNVDPGESAIMLFPARAGADAAPGSFDDDYTPAAGTSLAGAGRSSIMWVTTPEPLTYSVGPRDLDDHPRASPPAIGALEPR